MKDECEARLRRQAAEFEAALAEARAEADATRAWAEGREAEAAEQRARQAEEVERLEERVRGAIGRKDETIAQLREQLAVRAFKGGSAGVC